MAMATQQERLKAALQKIWASSFVQENPKKAYQGYHPAEYQAVADYIGGGNKPTSFTSALGEGLAAVEEIARELGVVEPVPVPVPPEFVNSSIKAGQTLKGNVMWAVETAGDVAKVEFWANDTKVGEDVSGV